MIQQTKERNLEDIIENACEWIKALASNEFSQTQGRMKDMDGFCCLGVARHITDFGDVVHPQYELDLSELEWFEKEFLGLRDSEGYHVSAPVSLIRYNDERGYTFPMIAAALLCELESFFEDDVAAGVEDYFFNGGAA